MKKFLLLITLIPFLLFSENFEILFLSTPRSGTHWTLNCLCNLLEKQVIFNRGPTQGDIFLGRFSNFKKGFIYGAHNPKNLWIKKDGDKKDILILILRNYRECFTRNYGIFQAIDEIKMQATFNYLDKNKSQAFVQPNNHYFNNLRCYDLWNPAKRFLIRYEELILNPEKVLRKLAHFFNVKEEILNEFLENLDYHRKCCLDLYNYKCGKDGSKSGGKDILYHSKKLGFDKCVSIDSLVKDLFPYYFDKYLKRYEIKHPGDLQ